MNQAIANPTAPTAPIVPSALNLAGFRSPAEIAAGVPEKTRNPGDTVVERGAAPQVEAPTVESKSVLKRLAAQRKPATKKAKAERKPRIQPLSLGERHDVIGMIKLAPLTESDASLADRASAICSRAVSPSLIASYRVQLGFSSVKELSRAQMREKLAQLERELEAAKQPQLFDRALGQLMQGVANQVAADRLVATDTHSDQFGTFGVLGRSGDGNITFEPATLDEVWPGDTPKPPDTKVM